MKRSTDHRRRRSALLWLVGALILVSAAGAWWLRRTAPFILVQDPDQNVLLVTIDTLRADALSSYGGPAHTPHLDRLASHGARFTFAHAHAVTTLPSHTSILTGQLPFEHGMRDNSGFRVRAGTATLATRLKALGFATGAFVGGFPLTKRYGLTPGFDVYDDQMPEMNGIGAVSMPERRADVVVARAAEWVGTQQGRLFAWVHLFDPHSPYQPPDAQQRAYATQPYYGEVAFVDQALGPLLDRLQSLPRPTLVIVTADHGESLGEHGEATHGMFGYEATLRVPLLVSRVAPGRRPTAGIVVDIPARHVDLAPTVLDAVAANPEGGLAGTSLRNVIRTGRGDDRPLYFEAMTYNLVRGWAPLRGVVVDRDKYIDLPIAELYDLRADPSESQNTAARLPERLMVMANTLRTYDTAPPQRPGQESAEAVAALRSLGYVSGNAPVKASYTDDDDPKRLAEIDRDVHNATDLFAGGRTEAGMVLLERVIARRADTADAYITIAHAYWEGGQPQAAVAALERGLKNGAPDRDIRIRLGLYLAESGGDPARAIALLKDMPADDVEALNGLGVAYGDAGQLGDAVETFNRVLALDATNAMAYQNLGSITLRQALTATNQAERGSALQRAEAFARRAIEADAALAEAHTTMGVILASSGRKSDAIASWRRAVALDATQYNALYNLWSELAAAGRRDDAAAFGRQFVATAPAAFFGPDIARVRTYLGSALAR